MSSEDDCYQSTRLPCIVRTFNFTNERSFAKTSKSTIHNSTIWVRMTMSLKQAIPEYQELPFLKRGEVLKRSCKNDFYLLRMKIHFHTSGFTLCLVLKQSLGGNSGMSHRFIDKHQPSNHSFHLFCLHYPERHHTKINAGAQSLVRAGKIAISVCSVKLHCQKYRFVHGLDHRVLDCRSGIKLWLLT